MSKIRWLLHNNWFSEQKKKRGAEWINQFRGGYKSVSREVKRQYQYSFLAEVFAAARHSSYVIGSGSSGVGQIIAQTIASRVGADPNAFGVWTEDWLKYVVPELAEQALRREANFPCAAEVAADAEVQGNLLAALPSVRLLVHVCRLHHHVASDLRGLEVRLDGVREGHCKAL